MIASSARTCLSWTRPGRHTWSRGDWLQACLTTWSATHASLRTSLCNTCPGHVPPCAPQRFHCAPRLERLNHAHGKTTLLCLLFSSKFSQGSNVLVIGSARGTRAHPLWCRGASRPVGDPGDPMTASGAGCWFYVQDYTLPPICIQVSRISCLLTYDYLLCHGAEAAVVAG